MTREEVDAILRAYERSLDAPQDTWARTREAVVAGLVKAGNSPEVAEALVADLDRAWAVFELGAAVFNRMTGAPLEEPPRRADN